MRAVGDFAGRIEPKVLSLALPASCRSILSPGLDEAFVSATLPDRAVMFSGVVCVVLTGDSTAASVGL